MPRESKYTDEQLTEAVANSTSYRQVLILLGVAGKGGNYAGVKKRITNLAIDISHFVGQAHRKNNHQPKRDIGLYLNNTIAIQSNRLKRKLFYENIKARRCESCDNEWWMGKPIPLELDHINGDSNDNRLENLRVLCPNCHANTDTYRGKNIKVRAAR